jgi:hypothetical protein
VQKEERRIFHTLFLRFGGFFTIKRYEIKAKRIGVPEEQRD